MINRETFYAKYKTYFGKLNVSQVEGLNFLLEKLDASEVFNLANEYSYILSTIKHECAEKYKPITEMGNQAYLKSKKYYPYIGRGYVQLTWKANYQTFSDLLGIDMVNEPKLALEPENSWKILETGMSKGLYTGKKLSDYVNEDITDYINARRVINGTDRASILSGYAEKFYDCIEFE
jgi:predicted chitinase